MKKLMFFALGVLLLVSLVSANHYDSQYDSENEDYYWARDYYRSSDFGSHSRNTFRYNTYHHGYDYDNFNDYRDSVRYRYYPGYYRNNDYNARDYYNDNSGIGSQGSGRVFVKNSDYYLYHSKTFQKDYLVKCDAQPPSGSWFYIKCF